MTRRKILWVASALATIGILGLSSLWYGTSPRSGEKPFRVGFNTWVGYGPLYIAQETGIFKKHGLKVELTRLEGTGERRAALLAGRIDALGSTMDDFVVGLSEGVDGTMIAVIDESNGADGIIAKQGIKSVSDLRGKRIAVQPGFVNHFFLLYVLNKAGIAPNEFQLVPLEPDKAADALFAGEVDVAVTWEPHLSAIKDQKNFELVLTTADASAQHIIFDNLVVRTDVLNGRKKDVVELLKSWYESIAYMKQDPEASYKILAKAFGISEKEAAETMEGVYFPSLQENVNFMSENNNTIGALPIAKKVIELYVKGGVIKNAPSEKLITSNIAPEYLKEAAVK